MKEPRLKGKKRHVSKSKWDDFHPPLETMMQVSYYFHRVLEIFLNPYLKQAEFKWQRY
jgi:hypothetical protein